jgi:hypothetical protein
MRVPSEGEVADRRAGCRSGFSPVAETRGPELGGGSGNAIAPAPGRFGSRGRGGLHKTPARKWGPVLSQMRRGGKLVNGKVFPGLPCSERASTGTPKSLQDLLARAVLCRFPGRGSLAS